MKRAIEEIDDVIKCLAIDSRIYSKIGNSTAALKAETTIMELRLVKKIIQNYIDTEPMTLDRSDLLWKETEYANEAIETINTEINTPDASAFFLEGYNKCLSDLIE